MAFIANFRASVTRLGISNSFDIAPSYTEFVTPRSLVGFDAGSIHLVLHKIFNGKIRFFDWIIRQNFIVGKFLYEYADNLKNNPYPIEKAFNYFLKEIDKNLREPYFAWIHLMPPHAPYIPPGPYMGMFNHSQSQRSFKSQRRVTSQNPLNPDEISTRRDRYDEFIRYCDAGFGEFIRELEARNQLKKTIIILSSDHGESFEHSYIGHSQSELYEQVTNIPLIIKEPGRMGRIIHDHVEQIDIPATILDLANAPVSAWMEGRSLTPFMLGKKLPVIPIFASQLGTNPARGHEITKGTIAVWEGDYKLIHYLEEEESLLFNLKQDSEEMDNLIEREPEIGKRLLDLINTNLKKANERIRSQAGS